MIRSTYTSRAVKEAFLNAILEDNAMFLVYDCETTGLDPQTNHIIQLSVRKCFITNSSLEEVDTRVWWINPGYALSDFIMNLTGITDEFLCDKPRECEVIDEIVDYFENIPVLGYNNDKFDNMFMHAMFERYDSIFNPTDSVDLYKVVKNVIPPGETQNHKLVTIAKHFGVNDKVQYHNAEGDTMATIFCCNVLIGLCQEKLEEEYENLIRCKVISISRWDSPYNSKLKRIYVETDLTTFYYDLYYQVWYTKSEAERIEKYDLEDVVLQVLDLVGILTVEELAAFEGRLVA